MKISNPSVSMLIILMLAAGLLNGPISAADKNSMQGWGINSPYNKHYDVSRFEKLKAWVVGFKTEAPMPGMSPGTIMVVETGIQLIDVHIGPTWFAKPGDIGVKKGERIKIRGCRAVIDQKEVFMAAKIKKGNYFEFKVRLTKSGRPFWTMTPEELIRQRPAADR